MEVSISGFKEQGSWSDIVEHGEKIAVALEVVAYETDYSIDESAMEEFNDWRPKISDTKTEKDISDRTSEQMSINEGKGEQEDKDPLDDVGKAASELGKSVNSLENREIKETGKSWKNTTAYMTRATDTTGRKLLRKLEKFVYKHVMTAISPYYFDNSLISANIQPHKGEKYTFEVNINNDTLKTHMKRILGELDSVDRWHLDHHDMEIPDVAETIDNEDVSHTATMEADATKETVKEEFEKSEQEEEE